MSTRNDILTAKVNAALDGRARDALGATFGRPDEIAVERLREAADAVTYSDTVEMVLARADQLSSELDGDFRREVEEIAERLRRRRDAKAA
jgi:hypothetical protein